MVDYTPEFLALQQVLFGHKSTREALFRVYMEEKLSQTGKKQTSKIVLGVLWKYFSLSFECLSFLPYKQDSEEFLPPLILLYILRFYPQQDEKELERCYLDTIASNRLLNDGRNDFAVLSQAAKKSFLIPDEVKKNPFYYNSLTLEMPEFLLRRMSADFSPKAAFQVAMSLKKKTSYFYFSRNEKEEEGMKKVSLSFPLDCYRSSKKLSVQEAKERKLIPSSYIEALAFSHLYVPPLMPKVLITGGQDGFEMLPLAFLVEECYDSQLDTAYETEISYRAALDKKNAFQLKKVHVLQSDSKLLKTYLSYDEYDDVVCFGRDCKIGCARHKIGILPSLKEEMLIKSKERQIEDLLENARFVKEGGSLLFVNNGLEKVETQEVIDTFLTRRKDFIAMETRMVFPFEMDSDGGYYAILKRRVTKHD